MRVTNRTSSVLLALVMAGGAATTLSAQIPGMPLFTNPRYGTGLRIHGDIGRPTETDPTLGDLTVYQAGVSLALGPVGINANVGTLRATAEAAQGCIASPTVICAYSSVTASALAQVRVHGAGRNNLSLAVFGGASMDIDAGDAVAGGVAPNKLLSIPVGVSVGYHISLGVASLNLWGAPRYRMAKFVNCSGGCPTSPKGKFGWAVGADLPIFRIISVRAAYDAQSVEGGTFKTIGAGVSIGIGGMR